MVAIKNITTEINRLMVGAFPAAQAHINACPEDFERPAYLIRCTRFEQTDANRSTVMVSSSFAITYLPELNEFQIADGDVLANAQNNILSLFSSKRIAVGDRNLSLKSVTDVPSGDSATVTVQLDYYDDRPELPVTAPMMGSVLTTTKLD